LGTLRKVFRDNIYKTSAKLAREGTHEGHPYEYTQWHIHQYARTTSEVML
jgi:hypothetical protein